MTERNYLPLRRLDWRLIFAFFAVLTICLFFYRQLDYAANGAHRSPLLTFTEEAIGGFAGLLVFPLAYVAALRFPLLSSRWRRNLALQIFVLCGISIIHTSLIALLHRLLLPRYDYGILRFRYPMEFAHLFIFYWVMLSLIYLFHEIRFAREREVNQAKLEASLSEAQLQNLRLQLEPHFLFNALNAISNAIYEDPRVADEMVGRLSELLRHLLKSEPAQQVTLAREVELLQLYLRVMEARLEHRLRVSIQLEEELKSSLVPQLILQPLIENAIRHGMDPVTFQVRIVIAARRLDDNMLLTVRDFGPGIDATIPPASGIGLRNTRDRLERLYGRSHRFDLANAPDGGAVASLELPL